MVIRCNSVCVVFKVIAQEGAIMALLDTPNLPKMTVWHMIDEGWLKKWRKFVMGRGARRYFPPGANSKM